MYCSSLDGLTDMFAREGHNTDSTITPGTDLECGSSRLTLLTSSGGETSLRRCSPSTRQWCILLLVVLVIGVAIGLAVLLTHPSAVQNCRFGDWYDADPCSRPCGGGEQWQAREHYGACPPELAKKEWRKNKCNLLACPTDCCFDWTCPFQVDLLCNSTNCHAFLNMSHCEFPLPGSITFNSTVYGRPVRWKDWHLRKSWVTLLDQHSQWEFTNPLNDSSQVPTRQAVCECLQEFSQTILRKTFDTSCLDLHLQ